MQMCMLVPLQPTNSSTPTRAQVQPRCRGRERKFPAAVCRALAIVLFGIPATRGLAQQEPNSVANPTSRGGITQRGTSPGPEAERSRQPEAHEEEPLETDRDSFTPATRLAGKGRFILEAAYTYTENRGLKETHSFPEALIRYGLLERLELRLGWNYEVGAGGEAFAEGELTVGNELERESRLSYGIKAAITQQDRWIPRSALILTGWTPTSGRETATQFVGTYVVGWEFPNRWECNASIRYGMASQEGDDFTNWAPSVVLKVPIHERWNAHVEYFGIFSSGKNEEYERHFISPGIHYLINPNLEVGVRVGWGLNDQSARFFTNVGFGWRF
jgi:hypothetical protein